MLITSSQHIQQINTNTAYHRILVARISALFYLIIYLLVHTCVCAGEPRALRMPSSCLTAGLHPHTLSLNLELPL